MYKENFPPRIKKARIDAGYKQAEVADITGIPRSNISKYETGKQEPSLELNFNLAKLLLFLISTRYVPPFAEIQGFFKIKIRRSSLRVFL